MDLYLRGDTLEYRDVRMERRFQILTFRTKINQNIFTAYKQFVWNKSTVFTDLRKIKKD